MLIKPFDELMWLSSIFGRGEERRLHPRSPWAYSGPMNDNRLVFDRAHFPGEIALTLPKNIEFADPNRAVTDFTEVPRDAFKEFFHEEVGRWFERVGELIERFGEKLAGDPSDDLPRSRRSKKLASLDRSRIYHADTGLPTPTIRGAVLSPHALTAASATPASTRGRAFT